VDVYDAYFGNTKVVAEAIAEQVEGEGSGWNLTELRTPLASDVQPSVGWPVLGVDPDTPARRLGPRSGCLGTY
jgi:hypothetical protein